MPPLTGYGRFSAGWTVWVKSGWNPSRTALYPDSAMLLGCICIIGFTDASVLEGLLPDLMRSLSLFERFNAFVSGVFDLTALVYYGSVILFFLFLTVQSLEKRRYN